MQVSTCINPRVPEQIISEWVRIQLYYLINIHKLFLPIPCSYDIHQSDIQQHLHVTFMSFCSVLIQKAKGTKFSHLTAAL